MEKISKKEDVIELLMNKFNVKESEIKETSKVEHDKEITILKIPYLGRERVLFLDSITAVNALLDNNIHVSPL